jgi:hypothetical protein
MSPFQLQKLYIGLQLLMEDQRITILEEVDLGCSTYHVRLCLETTRELSLASFLAQKKISVG